MSFLSWNHCLPKNSNIVYLRRIAKKSYKVNLKNMLYVFVIDLIFEIVEIFCVFLLSDEFFNKNVISPFSLGNTI